MAGEDCTERDARRNEFTAAYLRTLEERFIAHGHYCYVQQAVDECKHARVDHPAWVTKGLRERAEGEDHQRKRFYPSKKKSEKADRDLKIALQNHLLRECLPAINDAREKARKYPIQLTEINGRIADQFGVSEETVANVLKDARIQTALRAWLELEPDAD